MTVGLVPDTRTSSASSSATEECHNDLDHQLGVTSLALIDGVGQVPQQQPDAVALGLIGEAGHQSECEFLLPGCRVSDAYTARLSLCASRRPTSASSTVVTRAPEPPDAAEKASVARDRASAVPLSGGLAGLRLGQPKAGLPDSDVTRPGDGAIEAVSADKAEVPGLEGLEDRPL